MGKKKIVKTSAVLVAALLAAQSMGVSALVEDIVNVRTTSDTQMVSASETFFVNNVTTSRSQNFNDNWKFNFGEVSGAQAKAFDDSKWETVSVPHDYSINQKYQANMEAESGYLPGGTGWYRKYFNVSKDMLNKEFRLDFDGVYMNATVYVNGHRLGMHPYGYTPFSYDISEHLVEGENVIAVKVDHKTPSSRWYSGSGIYRDVKLTVMDKVHVDLFGQKIETKNLANELASGNVKVNLKTTILNESSANKNVSVKYSIYEKDKPSTKIAEGVSEATAINAGQKNTFNIDLTTTKAPKLWDVTDPNLYTVKTEVMIDGTVVDTIEEEFGFRYFSIDKDKGAKLNGQPIKLKGVCMHHDQGSLGAAAYRDAIERQVDILKEMGCNSIRVTHNPASDVLIDICNEKGMLLIEEFFDGWHSAKNGNTHDYSGWFERKIGTENSKLLNSTKDMTWAEFDLKSTVARGQNSPAIVMWSLGNEIQEGAAASGYYNNAVKLVEWAKNADSTRYITIGSNKVKDHWEELNRIADLITENGGLSGTNYSNGNSYDELRRRHPNWTIYGSETASAVNSRGVYTTKASASLDGNNQLTSYDKSAVSWGATAAQAWYDVIKRDFVSGEYVWTGFDYIGEPTPANGIGPNPGGFNDTKPKSSYFGIVDTAGFEKDSYYLYQSQWNDSVDTLHILPTWNENGVIKNGKGEVEVVVYSDADKVELYLDKGNGTTPEKVGEQEFITVESDTKQFTYKVKKDKKGEAKDLYATFDVKYAPGRLFAKAFKKNADGVLVDVTEQSKGRKEVITSSDVAKLSAKITNATKLAADGDDLAYIEVDVTDANGNIVPDAKNRVTFKVEGPAELVGVDNGSSPDHDSYKANNRRAHAGKVLGIVKSIEKAGEIRVTVSSPGLESQTVTIRSEKTLDEHASTTIDSYTISRNIYVKEGTRPSLPATVSVTFEDGKVASKNVTWQEPTAEQLSSKQPYQLKGTIEGAGEVFVTVYTISDVAAVLNYSTTVPVGTTSFSLPETRPVVFVDGTVSNVMLNVNWDEIAKDSFKNPGVVTVNGTATVLGKTEKVTATIRVQEASYTLGENVATSGKRLGQDIPQEYQRDTLAAIINENKGYDPNSKNGDDNTTVWSNYKYSQPANVPNEKDRGQENPNATIWFDFDTQQTIGKISVTFARDNWSMRYPNPQDIQFFADGQDATHKINVTKYPQKATSTEVGTATYEFEIEPTLVTKFYMKLKNDTSASTMNSAYRPCTGIAEIELFKTVGSFNTNTTSALQSLTVNGKALTASELERGYYNTPVSTAELTNIATKDNAAVTVLPVFNKQVKLIIESEDHKTMNVFTINLEREPSIAPEDASKDIKLENSWIAVDNAQNGEGKEKMLDNSADSLWHSLWNGNMSNNPEKRYIQVTFPEKYTVNGIRYLSRKGGTNGCVTKHSILYKENENDTTWKKASIVLDDGTVGEIGTWPAAESTWRSATIKPVNAKVIRFMGVETVADGGRNNHFMSCSEFRVVGSKAVVQTDISTLASKTTLSHEKMDNDGNIVLGDVKGEVKPTVVVKDANNKVLAEGVDYTLTYANNTAFGTASVTITGIGNYTGTFTKEFTILECPHATNNLELVEKEEATCKKDGYTGNKRCKNCGKVVEYGTVVSKLGHKWSEWKVVTPATTEKVGLEERVCTREGCSEKEQRDVAKLVNKELLKEDVQKAKAITANGYTETSYKALQDVINICEGVLNNEKATQAEVNAAVNNLAAAVKGLVKVDSQDTNKPKPDEQDTNKPSENKPKPEVPGEPIKPVEPQKPGQTPETKPEQTPVKPVQPNKDETGTGDVTNMSMVASMLAASGFAVSSLFKRRNKK